MAIINSHYINSQLVTLKAKVISTTHQVLIISLQLTAFLSLCLLNHGVLLCISSQLHLQWHHIDSLKSAKVGRGILCVVLSRSVVSDSAIPWTVGHQAPLPMGILQARILEWVSMPSSRGFCQPRDQTQVSIIAGRFFTVWGTREAQVHHENW